jgi:hypothetical protein
VSQRLPPAHFRGGFTEQGNLSAGIAAEEYPRTTPELNVLLREADLRAVQMRPSRPSIFIFQALMQNLCATMALWDGRPEPLKWDRMAQGLGGCGEGRVCRFGPRIAATPPRAEPSGHRASACIFRPFGAAGRAFATA